MTDAQRAHIDETVGDLPKSLDWLPDRVRAQGGFKEQVIVYRSYSYRDPLTEMTEDCVKAVCTGCGEDFVADKYRVESGCHSGYAPAPFGYYDPIYNMPIINNEDCLCPRCGCKAKAWHIGRIGRSGWGVISSECVMTMHSINEHFAILSWQLDRSVNKDGQTDILQHLDEGLVIINGKPVRVCGYVKTMNSISWLNEWKWRVRYDERIGRVSPDRIFIDSNEIAESEAKNSSLAEYISSSGEYCFPGAYLMMWTKCNPLENLSKLGYGKLLTDIIKESYSTSYTYTQAYFDTLVFKRYINVFGKKPHELLNCEKYELPYYKKYKLDTMALYTEWKDQGTRLTEQQLEDVEKIGNRWISWHEATKEPFHGFKVPIVRSINYIKKQLKLHSSSDFTELKDYWSMLYRYYGRIPEDMTFPKCLYTEHNRIHQLIEIREKQEKREKLEKELRELDVKIAKIAASLALYEYRDEESGLMIRPCASATELVNEGDQLKHCVGGYRQNVADGRTMIYFIRKISEPDKPFYTLEYKNNSIVQDHGYKNVLQTPEILKFENKWLEHITSLKGANNGKRNRKSKQSNTRTA